MSLTFEDSEMRMRADAQGFGSGFRSGAVLLIAPRARAYVNQGRWVAGCPSCPAARQVNPDYGLWCVECGASAIIEWPSAETMREIDDVLGYRPRTNQNYHPDDYLVLHPANSPRHEPCPDAVTFLAYENDVRGLPIGNDIVRARYEKWLQADWKKRGLAKEMAGFNVEAK